MVLLTVDYEGFIVLSVPAFQLRELGTGKRLVLLLLQTEEKKTLCTSAFSLFFVTVFLPTFSKEQRFSLALLLLLMYL